ncbi:MAG: hypothetical protein ACFFCK_04435 [Promethearchaeota archaeon]
MGRKRNIILAYLVLGLVFVVLVQLGILERGNLLVEILVYVFFAVALPYMFFRSILGGPHELM